MHCQLTGGDRVRERQREEGREKEGMRGGGKSEVMKRGRRIHVIFSLALLLSHISSRTPHYTIRLD